MLEKKEWKYVAGREILVATVAAGFHTGLPGSKFEYLNKLSSSGTLLNVRVKASITCSNGCW